MKIKMAPFIPITVIAFALVLSATHLASLVQALPSSGGLFISIPNSSIKCANIVLPDDAGYYGRGAVDYVLTMTPDPQDTWSDFSYQRVTTDENNTAVIPICFSSIGKPIGNCSEPFTIRISAPSIGVNKTWHGGACASDYADFDTSAPVQDAGGDAEAQDPMEGLDDADVFSIGFVEPTKYVAADEMATFTLWLESYADLEIGLSVEGGEGLYVTPASAHVSTGSASGTGQSGQSGESFHEINFTVGGVGQEGRYSFDVVGTAQDCGPGSMCTRQANAELVVGDVPDLAGFMVSLFPENLNIRDLEPVTYRIAITNFGDDGEFTATASLPDGLTTTFAPATMTVPSGEYRTITFTITPGSASQSYELDFTVTSSGGVAKPVTAYLSTNELLTDVSRSMDLINQVADAQTRNQASQGLDRWYQTYQSSDYGQDMDEHSDLQATLQEARQAPADAAHDPSDGDTNGDDGDGDPYYPQDTTNGDGDGEGFDLFGKDLWILLVVVLVVLGAVLFFVQRSKKPGNELDEEIDLEKGF